MKLHRNNPKHIKSKVILVILLAGFMFYGCNPHSEEAAHIISPNGIHSTPKESVSDEPPQKEAIENRCRKITDIYTEYYIKAEKLPPQNIWDHFSLSNESIAHMEDILISAGYHVLISNGAYPSYLGEPEAFLDFWEEVQENQNAYYEMVEIMPSGALSYQLFICENGTTNYYSMICAFEPDDTPSIVNFEQHTVFDWELSDKGNFYFRIYPADDKHYADYTLIKLYPPDKELCDMTEKYLSTVGYNAVNLFLLNWTEQDFGAVSFNDLWDALYYRTYGRQFNPDTYTPHSVPFYYEIPAAEFESIVLPYFNIELEEFREKAHYHADGNYYPWRPFLTNDVIWYYYPTTFPEVTSYQVNPDGTMTLHVEVLSTDLKTDCLFSHDVTVRPFGNGSFQYVGNQIITQTEYGLPPAESRFEVEQKGF